MSETNQGVTDKALALTLLKNEGSFQQTAKELGVSVAYLRRRSLDSDEISDAMAEFQEILVDEAIVALRGQLREGNTRLIEFTLDRLGKGRGFVKQGVNDTLSISADIAVKKELNISTLSNDEKLVLMKAAKKQLRNADPSRHEEPIQDAELVDDET